MRFVKIPDILSTVPDPDPSFVLILSCTGKTKAISIIKPQFALILAGSFTFRCVYDNRTKIASAAANKVR